MPGDIEGVGEGGFLSPWASGWSLASPGTLWPHRCPGWDGHQAFCVVKSLVSALMQTLPPTFPGSPWQAQSSPWYRWPWGSWCGSSAQMTAPWTPTPGGRKTGGLSPLTGVCAACTAPLISWDGRVSVCGATAPLIGARLIVASGAQSSSALSSFRHQLQPDGSLVISPLRAEDTGTYSCGSTRPDRDSQKIQLRITGLCPHPPAVGPHGPRGGVLAGRAWAGGPRHWRTSVSLG